MKSIVRIMICILLVGFLISCQRQAVDLSKYDHHVIEGGHLVIDDDENMNYGSHQLGQGTLDDISQLLTDMTYKYVTNQTDDVVYIFYESDGYVWYEEHLLDADVDFHEYVLYDKKDIIIALSDYDMDSKWLIEDTTTFDQSIIIRQELVRTTILDDKKLPHQEYLIRVKKSFFSAKGPDIKYVNSEGKLIHHFRVILD